MVELVLGFLSRRKGVEKKTPILPKIEPSPKPKRPELTPEQLQAREEEKLKMDYRLTTGEFQLTKDQIISVYGIETARSMLRSYREMQKIVEERTAGLKRQENSYADKQKKLSPMARSSQEEIHATALREVTGKMSEVKNEKRQLSSSLPSRTDYLTKQVYLYQICDEVNKETGDAGKKLSSLHREQLRNGRNEIIHWRNGQFSDNEFRELAGIVRDWGGNGLEDLTKLIEQLTNLATANLAGKTDRCLDFLKAQRRILGIIRPEITEVNEKNIELIKKLRDICRDLPAIDRNGKLVGVIAQAVFREGVDLSQAVTLAGEAVEESGDLDDQAARFQIKVANILSNLPKSS